MLRRSLSSLALSLLFLVSPAVAQPLDAPGGPVERYTLPNGVIVLLQPVPSLPTVAISLVVPVGSASDARPGTCHLLAQLLSRSPGSYPQGSLQLNFEEMGARSGYLVLPRWTVFHEAVPRQQLGWLLNVEMERLKPAKWSAEEIERQSAILAEDWRSEGATLEGSERHLLLARLQGGAADKEPAMIAPTELQQFALQYWNPPATKNVGGPILAIVGGFTPKTAKDILAKLGAGSPPGSPQSEPPVPTPIGGVADLAGGNEIHWLYPLPVRTEDLAVLALLDAKVHDAPGVTTSMDYVQNSYSVRRAATVNTTLADEDDLHGRLQRAGLGLLDPASLKYAQYVAVSRFYKHFEDIQTRASELALDQGISQLDRLSHFAQMLRQITSATIANSAVRVLDDRLAAKVHPAAGAFTPTAAAPRAVSGELPRSLPVKLGTPPDFSAKPEAPPAFQRLELERGVTILVQNIPDVPTVTVRGFIAGGMSLDSAALAGRAQIVAASMEERAHGELHFSAQPQFIGIEGWTSRDGIFDWLRQLAAALAPQALGPGPFELGRARAQKSWQQESGNQELQAYQRWLGLLYGDDNPYGRDAKRYLDSSQTVTLAQTNELLQQLTRPNRLTLVFSGNISTQEITQLLNPLISTLGAQDPAPSTLPLGVARRPGEKPPVVRLSGASSPLILTGTLAPSRTDPDYYAFAVLNQILGGESVAGRLALRLRDKDGLVTVTQSRFLAGQGPMPFLISVRVRPGRVQEALAALEAELERLRTTPISDYELQRAIHSLEGTLQVSQASGVGRANLLRTLELFHLPDTYVGFYRGVTAKQLQEVAQRRLAPVGFCTVILKP